MSTASRGQDLVNASDGLPALEVAAHAREKAFAFERIADIFTMGMRNKWRRLYYIDLFAGPGKCRIKGAAAEIDGSPVLAAKSKAKFTDYYLADKNPDCLTALKSRIDGLGLPELTNVKYYEHEADVAAYRIQSDLPPSRVSLGLGILDPWGWDFSFETMAALSKGRRLDLVINFPIGYIKRNWEKELPALDKFMNGQNYKEPFKAAMRHEPSSEMPARVLLDFYSEELKGIGYEYISDHVMVDNSKHLPMYYLIFASKHELGADFWEKVTRRKQSGQFRMLG